MLDINDFIEKYYNDRPIEMMTLKEFEEYKEKNGYEEWDYPLEEYEHIAENEIKCKPVRFSGQYIGYEYRFCEIPNN